MRELVPFHHVPGHIANHQLQVREILTLLNVPLGLRDIQALHHYPFECLHCNKWKENLKKFWFTYQLFIKYIFIKKRQQMCERCQLCIENVHHLNKSNRINSNRSFNAVIHMQIIFVLKLFTYPKHLNCQSRIMIFIIRLIRRWLNVQTKISSGKSIFTLVLLRKVWFNCYAVDHRTVFPMK